MRAACVSRADPTAQSSCRICGYLTGPRTICDDRLTGELAHVRCALRTWPLLSHALLLLLLLLLLLCSGSLMRIFRVVLLAPTTKR